MPCTKTCAGVRAGVGVGGSRSDWRLAAHTTACSDLRAASRSRRPAAAGGSGGRRPGGGHAEGRGGCAPCLAG
eukprot:10150617-Alexandrium_andersonii.AAC.1